MFIVNRRDTRFCVSTDIKKGIIMNLILTLIFDRRIKNNLPLILIIFAFIFSQELYSENHLYQVYLDTVDNVEASGLTTWGDSSVVYSGVSKSGWAQILKTTNLGKTWGIAYTEWVDDNNHHTSLYPFRDVRIIQHPAPGYTYLLYDGCGLKHLDERAGTIVDSVDFGFESGQSIYFNMMDSINGIIYHKGKTFVTHNGWITYDSTKLNAYYNDKGEVRGYGISPSLLQMLSPDTVLIYGDGYIDSLSRGFSFNKLIIGENSIFRYEKFADTVFDVSAIGWCTAFKRFSDTLIYFTMKGRKTGYGNCREFEIYKMSGPEHKITQIYRKNVHGFFGLEDLQFIDEKNAIAAGDGVIITTSDGGNTWEIDTVFYDNGLMSGFKNSWWWNPRIDYVDGMIFITSYNMGVWRYGEYTPEAISEEEYIHPKIYPNPVQAGQILHIESRSFLHAKAYIYDIQGNEVDSFDFYGNSLPIRADLPAGAYFLIVEENGKYPVREKFIISP